MKVYLNMDGPLSPLYRRFNLEGDSVSKFKQEADLVLDDPITFPELLSEHNEEIAQASMSQDVAFVVSRYFHLNEWLPQVSITVPLFGLMNDNLGPSVCTGSGTRYLKEETTRLINDFERYTLTLKEMEFSGFVSLSFNNERIRIAAQTSIPFYGLFSVLEGVRGKLSEWFTNPNRLYESWVVSVLVSQHPWPELLPDSCMSKIVHIREDLEKHFWSFPLAQQQKGLIGIATAWAGIEDESIHAQHGTLRRAASFALKTAASIEIPEKQYRTDIAERVQEQWIRLKNLGIV